MKGGVLGIIVVCVILGASILLVSVLDVQEGTQEVTKYKYVTDTTSLFDFDKKPQYQDYDMVTNTITTTLSEAGINITDNKKLINEILSFEFIEFVSYFLKERWN